jgi:hypothetical protein
MEDSIVPFYVRVSVLCKQGDTRCEILLFAELDNPLFMKYKHRFDIDAFVVQSKKLFKELNAALMSEEFYDYCQGLAISFSETCIQYFPSSGFLLQGDQRKQNE